MVKWDIELSEFRIKFAPQTAIKMQCLADFIVESIKSFVREASAIKETVKRRKPRS